MLFFKKKKKLHRTFQNIWVSMATIRLTMLSHALRPNPTMPVECYKYNEMTIFSPVRGERIGPELTLQMYNDLAG